MLVEGEFDVISSGQAHITHVAGLKGSALTTDHVRLLSRLVDRIILSLDADAAGVAATKRAVSVLQNTPVPRNTPLDLRVSVVPEGKDPDELARKDPKAWRTVIKQSQPAYEFLVRTACSQQDIESAVGKQKVLYEIAPILNAIPHQVEREHYLQLTSQLLHTSKQSVAADIATLGNRQISAPAHSKNSGSADKNQKSTIVSPLSSIEVYVLFLWTKLPDADFSSAVDQLAARTWQDPSFASILQLASQEHPQSVKQLTQLLSDDLQQVLFEIHTNPTFETHLTQNNLQKEWQSALKKLNQFEAKAEAKRIGEALAILDNKAQLTAEEKSQQSNLLQELSQLMAKQRIAE